MGICLKGIAFGVVGGRLAEGLGVEFGKGAVRFEDVEEVGQIVVIPPEVDREPEPEKDMSPEASRSLVSFRMEVTWFC